jgi:hypothetical protein
VSEIEKYYNGEIIVDFEEETELEKNYNEVAELYSKAVKKKIEYRKEIERLNNIINELEKSKEKQINDYEILILKIERYLNCYQYFLETQEENNKKIANMIHEFSSKDSDKE